ncbi:MAG: pitrilysin family protein [Oceanipulchritudo sp.]
MTPDSPPGPSPLPPSLQSLLAETPESIVLDNGLQLVFQEVPEHPVVSTQVWIRTGSIHEEGALGSGLSHFLEHMLFKGSERRRPGEIAREVQAFGGSINAYTAFDRTVYYIDGPSEGLDQSLDLLCDMTLHARLPAEEVIKEKDVILREIDMTLDDPDRILLRSLFATAFREHPFRYPVIGLRPLFEQVDRDVLSAYYEARYVPENMVLSVVGDIDRNGLLETVGRTFGAVPRTPVRPIVIPSESSQLAIRENRLEGDYQTARGMLAFKIPSMRHPEAPALDVLAAIVGSGQSGRLRQKLREDMGLVHDISASAWNPGQPGLFVVQYQCDPDKADRAEEAVRATFEAYREHGFTAQELEKARRFASVSEVHARQTISGLASRNGLISALVGDLHYPEQFFRRIHALSLEDLQSLAGKTFRNDQLSLVSLRPPAPAARTRPARENRDLPPFEEVALPNGARILWQADHRLPRTCMRFSGLGGSLFEDPSHRGATSLLTTLLARDTRFNTAYQVARNLESDGGFLIDASGNNSFSLATEVMPEMARQGLRALEEAVLYPAFKEATLNREREAQLAHLHILNDEILDHGRLAMRALFFGSHPFASDPAGSLESCARIDKPCLNSLYNRLIVAPNSLLVIAGDFDPEKLIPHARAFMEQLPGWSFRSLQRPFTGPAATGLHSRTLNREQSVVFEAYPDVGITAENDCVAQLLDEILSDMSGPLFRSVREEHSLAYFVGAARILAPRHGVFYLYAGTQPGKAGEIYGFFAAELERIRTGGLGQEELDAARTRLVVQNRFSLQNPATRAARASLNALYGKPVMDWLNYENRLKVVTVEDIAAFTRQHLSPETALRLTVGPEFD